MTAVWLVIGGVACAWIGAALLLTWLWSRHQRIRKAQLASLLAHIERHPAGRNLLAERPWDLPAPCCGGTIYGDSLPELLVNRAYHESQCPVFNERKAA